jgi:hypothetical protein
MGIILFAAWWFFSSTIDGIDLALRGAFWWMVP